MDDVVDIDDDWGKRYNVICRCGYGGRGGRQHHFEGRGGYDTNFSGLQDEEGISQLYKSQQMRDAVDLLEISLRIPAD